MEGSTFRDLRISELSFGNSCASTIVLIVIFDKIQKILSGSAKHGRYAHADSEGHRTTAGFDVCAGTAWTSIPVPAVIAVGLPDTPSPLL